MANIRSRNNSIHRKSWYSGKKKHHTRKNILLVRPDNQKSQNKTLAQIRVKVENAICGVKRSHAVADTYRNIKTGFDDLLMSVACGLHNVRVAYRYQKV